MRTHEDVGELVVTPEQLKDGYALFQAPPFSFQVPTTHAYEVITKLDNGNFVVKDPRTTTTKEDNNV